MSTSEHLDKFKQQQRSVWSSGDYSVIGTRLLLTAELLAEACDLRYDELVLDVAAGNGNASLAAARRGCQVTSTDFVEGLLERGRERARAERFDVTFMSADAEHLPFEDGRFDVVLSTFGVMFTPDQKRAATELTRVCRPGGRIGLTCWTPDGFVGKMFKVLNQHRLPAPNVPSPLTWGTETGLHNLFASHTVAMQVTVRLFNMRYRSAEHLIDTFRNWYGPLRSAFASLGDEGAEHLHHDLSKLINEFNRAGTNSLVVPAEYLEVVMTR